MKAERSGHDGNSNQPEQSTTTIGITLPSRLQHNHTALGAGKHPNNGQMNADGQQQPTWVEKQLGRLHEHRWCSVSAKHEQALFHLCDSREQYMVWRTSAPGATITKPNSWLVATTKATKRTHAYLFREGDLTSLAELCNLTALQVPILGLGEWSCKVRMPNQHHADNRLRLLTCSFVFTYTNGADAQPAPCRQQITITYLQLCFHLHE
jgi:hypothetical protein